MDRQMIDYLPSFIQGYKQIESIMTVEQPEIESTWKESGNMLNNLFVMTANDSGIKLWERLLSITPKLTTTLDERRFTVFSRMNEKNVYTYQFLEFQLQLLCGQGGYSINLKPNEYSIEVKVELTAKSKENDVKSLLKRICPANLLLGVSLLYNQHQTLKPFTHKYLTRFTHYELRNEVLR